MPTSASLGPHVPRSVVALGYELAIAVSHDVGIRWVNEPNTGCSNVREERALERRDSEDGDVAEHRSHR
jgi:hypothetical protein